MRETLEKSLLLRMGLMMATITALAFIGMLSSVIIAEITQGAAAAINQAGSLRMQSYRIASSLAPRHDVGPLAAAERTGQRVKEFNQRILSPRLTAMLPKEDTKQVRTAYNRIYTRWRQEIRPPLMAYVDEASERHAPKDPEARRIFEEKSRAAQTVARQQYLAVVDDFVAGIDHFVTLLEDDAEFNIQLLRVIQVVSLFLTLVVVFITMYFMHNGVLVPLRDLLTCAESARSGDFSMRTGYQGEDELGQLGNAFNVMAEDLSKMYADLEARVQQKTADLEHSNRSLELLYNTTRWLNESPLADATYNQLLNKIEELIGIGPGTICLAGEDISQAVKLATTRHVPLGAADLCTPPNCSACFGDGDTHVIEIRRNADQTVRVLSLPITDQEQQYGVLLMEIPSGIKMQEWQTRLLEAVADHIGIAINIAQRASQGRRLALLDERSVIARELHDSLAQSLSYMKIQVSRLDAVLPHNAQEAQARAIMQELRDGINSAYRELRELLTTFRLKMDGRGLSSALEDTVAELHERSSLEVSLINRLHVTQLTPNEEIHVLQVVREALSNVVRHAHAQHAQVALASNVDGDIVVTIDDDGVGIPEEAERLHHYGLAIMNERVESLRGRITINRRTEGGTRVQVVFTPTHHKQSQRIQRGEILP